MIGDLRGSRKFDADLVEAEYGLPSVGWPVPAGIEAILIYNGLNMNVQSDTERYRVTSIDGLNDADIRDARDVNTAQDGETYFNAYYAGRTIVISGVIEAISVDGLRDMQQALRSAFADITQEKPLRFSTTGLVGDASQDHIIYCKKSAPIAGLEQQVNLKASRDFQVTLRASNPRFLSYTLRQAVLDPVPTVAVPTSLFDATNNGNYWAQPIFRIYGPATSIQIFNSETSESFTLTNVPADGFFEFDTSAPSLKNQNGLNQWNHLVEGSKYCYLTSGANSYYYQGDASIIEMFWRDTWM